ncbi:MAG: hypothetical protein ACOX52_00565 [Verrucomicrobiota bacterium]
MRRTPAENAEVYWEGECSCIGAVFNNHFVGPKAYTYTYTAKRYTFPYTRMRMELDQQKLGERVRVGVRVRGQGRRGAWPAIAPDPCRPADTVYPKKFSQIGRGQSVKPTHPL